MTAYEQRSYPGAAADTVLAADLAIGGTAFSVTAGTGTGYPDGSGGPFFVIIDWDNSKAEKIRCSGRVNDTFTVAGTGGGRGQDGTAAIAHTAPAKVRACITATDVQEANRAAVNTVGRITTKGDLTPGSGASTTVRFAVGADGTLLVADSTQPGGMRWTSTGIVLDATSTLGGVSGTQLAAARAAWTAYTPAFTNGTVGNGTLVGRSLLIGKTMYLYVSFTLGSTSSLTASQLTISIPSPGPVATPAVGAAFFSKGDFSSRASGVAQIQTAMTLQAGTGGLVTSTFPWTWATGDFFAVNAVYETV